MGVAGVAAARDRLGEADQRRDALDALGASSSTARDVGGEEVALQVEVLGRVAGHAELGEDRQLGARLAGAARSRPAILAALPSMSPTVGSIWARAMRIGACGRSPANYRRRGTPSGPRRSLG